MKYVKLVTANWFTSTHHFHNKERQFAAFESNLIFQLLETIFADLTSPTVLKRFPRQMSLA